MKVFQPGTHGRRTVFAQPGNEYPASNFLDSSGKPAMFSITFVEGEAQVDHQLGEYLIDKGLATRSPIIIPAGATS